MYDLEFLVSNSSSDARIRFEYRPLTLPFALVGASYLVLGMMYEGPLSVVVLVISVSFMTVAIVKVVRGFSLK